MNRIGFVPRKYIGLSLSQCIRSIAKGEVELEDVKMIVAGTWIQNDEQFEEVMHTYKFSPKERMFARVLWDEKKIVQPRCLFGSSFYHGISEGIWYGLIS
jgi:hypothetical protein